MALTPLLQSIRAVLRPALVGSGAIELAEIDPGSSVAPFRLKTTQPTLVLRFDDIPHEGMTLNDRLFPMFDVTRAGVSTSCDYVLLWQRNDDPGAPLYVLLAELKSSVMTGAVRQIENSRLLVDHLLATVRHHEGAPLLPERVRYRGVVFSPSARPPSGDPRRVPCPYRPASQAMPDLLLVRHPPCDGYLVDWFCTP